MLKKFFKKISTGYSSSWGTCSEAARLIEEAIKKYKPNLIVNSKL